MSVTLTHTRRTAGRGAGTREVSGRIRYLLLNAYARGGTVRTTLSMANLLAERGHDVEVASLVQHRPEPRYPVSPSVRLVSLTGTRPRRSRPGTVDNAVRWAGEVALRGTRSRLAHPRDRRCADLTLAHDHQLRHYVQAQDDCVVVATRLTLDLALAGLRTDRQVAVAQEHNHLSRHPDVRQDYAAHYPALDAVTVLTEGDAIAYRSLLDDACPVVVVPNAMPHGTVLRRSPLTAPVAVAAGSLVHRKGFDLLIDAWRTVAATHPEWRRSAGWPTPRRRVPEPSTSPPRPRGGRACSRPSPTTAACRWGVSRPGTTTDAAAPPTGGWAGRPRVGVPVRRGRRPAPSRRRSPSRWRRRRRAGWPGRR